jgi:hypothetical protein
MRLNLIPLKITEHYNQMKKLFFILILLPSELLAQLAGEWAGQAMSVAQVSGQAKASVKVAGNTVSGSFQTQMLGMISVSFQGQLSDINNATCVGYVDGQPSMYVILSREGGNLNVNLRTDASDYLYATLQPKVRSRSTGSVNENIVGTWKVVKYENNTKTTMFWKISEDGSLDGYQNTFWMSGYDRQGRNIDSETSGEPIPFIEKIKQLGGRLYTKGANEVWLKARGEKDEKFFHYQITNDQLIMFLGNGIKNTGERVGF